MSEILSKEKSKSFYILNYLDQFNVRRPKKWEKKLKWKKNIYCARPARASGIKKENERRESMKVRNSKKEMKVEELTKIIKSQWVSKALQMKPISPEVILKTEKLSEKVTVNYQV